MIKSIQSLLQSDSKTELNAKDIDVLNMENILIQFFNVQVQYNIMNSE